MPDCHVVISFVYSSLKLVYIFSVNPHLGPLQVSLSRMVMDIMKFFFLYVLVLFAFSCGKYKETLLNYNKMSCTRRSAATMREMRNLSSVINLCAAAT